MDVLPTRIGRYEILAELGQGAMGVVYKARDPQLERLVAIKTLRRDLGLPPAEYADLKQRFYQEAKAAGRLSQPNIVTIHDVTEVEGVPYIVMELLEGRTLADVIATEKQLRSEAAVELTVQVCAALDYAHARGVVHRDIKPGNIVVTAEGVAKVTDFGIARLAGSSVTRTGVVVGTPAYMSPEQVRGRPADGRSDLFSLGVVLYEALSGANPFQSDELTATLYQVVQVDPPPLRARNPDVPRALERVVARVMAKEPDQRYRDAGALAEALTAAIAEPGPGDATTVRLEPRAPARRWSRRLLGVAAAAGCLALAGIGWGVWTWLASEEPPAQTAAEAGGSSPGAGRGFRGWRAPVTPGAILVSTNPAVDVFLDGVPKGRTGDAPLVMQHVAPGEHRVTLRLGSREQELTGVVREGETLSLAHNFPRDADDVPLGKLLDATKDKALKTARDKLRELRDLTR